MLNFPTGYREIEGNTVVYLIVFDPIDEDYSSKSNCYLMLNGELVSDDIFKYTKDLSLDDFVTNQLTCNNHTNLYFPNFNDEFFEDIEIEKYISIPLRATLTLGNINSIYQDGEMSNWTATFEDLDSRGKELYHNIKELYIDKEVRILTFIK